MRIAMMVGLVVLVSCGAPAVTPASSARDLAFDHASRGASYFFGFGEAALVIPHSTRLLTSEVCQQAFEELSEAIRVDPSLEFAHSSRAAAYITLGEHVPAVEDLTNVIGLKPPRPWLQIAYLDRAIAYKALGMNDEARRDWEMQAELGPSVGSLEDYVDTRRQLPPAFECASGISLANENVMQ